MANAHVVEIAIPEGTDVSAMMRLARSKADDAGVTLHGDESHGRFEGLAEGRYEVIDRRLKIEVTKKPPFVPWKMVESALRGAFTI